MPYAPLRRRRRPLREYRKAPVLIPTVPKVPEPSSPKGACPWRPFLICVKIGTVKFVDVYIIEGGHYADSYY